MRRFHSQKLEKCIGIPAEQWVSRCHEISGLALETGCYTGYLRYGMYLGSIAPKCRVAGCSKQFCFRHMDLENLSAIWGPDSAWLPWDYTFDTAVLMSAAVGDSSLNGTAIINDAGVAMYQVRLDIE